MRPEDVEQQLLDKVDGTMAMHPAVSAAACFDLGRQHNWSDSLIVSRSGESILQQEVRIQKKVGVLQEV